MKLKADGKCFVCGHQNPQGLHVDFSVNEREKTISASHLFAETYQGYAGIVHGGILSLVLDEAMVKLAYMLGLPSVTGEITVRFPSPLHTFEKVLIQGRIVRVERRIIIAESRAENMNGTVVAEGRGRLFRQEAERR
jgi:uncharacterized protein (TIGR00369 family)